MRSTGTPFVSGKKPMMKHVASTTQAALQGRPARQGGAKGGAGCECGCVGSLCVDQPFGSGRTPHAQLQPIGQPPCLQLPHSQEDEDAPAHGAQHGQEGLPAAQARAGGKASGASAWRRGAAAPSRAPNATCCQARRATPPHPTTKLMRKLATTAALMPAPGSVGCRRGLTSAC